MKDEMLTIEQLENLGIEEGDSVYIGDYEFEFFH